MTKKGISKPVLERLPVYLSYLKSLPESAPPNTSATIIAASLGMGDVQVRKDLASISNSGKPKVGYLTTDLIRELESFLGYDNVNNAFLVGAGKLGKALLDYDGFKEYGLDIIAAFDSNMASVGITESGKSIFPISRFEDLCKRLNVHIGIIAVPAQHAQEVCNLMVDNGIMAIWNFAPMHLKVTKDILVQNENMAVSLALLSGHLAQKLKLGE